MKKIPQRNLEILLQKLEMYVRAGLSPDRALDLCKDGRGKSLEAIENAVFMIRSGNSLSKSLAANTALSKSARGIIEQGELSGKLLQSLELSRSLMENNSELKKKVVSSTIYPVVIGTFALLMTFGLIRGVMPQIIPMLESLHVRLPLLTRVVITCTELLMTRWHIILATVIIIPVAAVYLVKKFSFFRRLFEKILLNSPIVGKLVLHYKISIFLRSFGAMIQSGLLIEKCYANVVQSIDIETLRSILASRHKEIEKGIPLGRVLDFKIFPRFVPSILIAAESSGLLGVSLEKCAQILERNVEHGLKRVTSLLEPLMMIGMGIVVGSVALSIMLPIYDISKVLQHA